MSFANLRHDPLLALLYVIAQLLVLWDLHVFRVLERWRGQNGDHVAKWFDALAEFEAMASLGTLAHDHPDWCFPSVSEEHDQFSSGSLGHPLIAANACVRNDVELGPAGTFLLVTGSNMSGKSTLLRSIGSNVHLAQAGAPVCAASLALPPVEVATSMRVRDSLDDGVSFYMAELKRLKEVVDHSEQLREQGRSLLFLLDEILQGTNSAERHIAVSQVVRHLLAQQAFGAISTHDLELAASDTLMSSGKCVHFRETLVKDDRRMTFDYQMRTGVAPTTNALVLLEMVGLGERE